MFLIACVGANRKPSLAPTPAIKKIRIYTFILCFWRSEKWKTVLRDAPWFVIGRRGSKPLVCQPFLSCKNQLKKHSFHEGPNNSGRIQKLKIFQNIESFHRNLFKMNLKSFDYWNVYCNSHFSRHPTHRGLPVGNQVDGLPTELRSLCRVIRGGCVASFVFSKLGLFCGSDYSKMRSDVCFYEQFQL